ncbi:MAG TPA: sulfatase [Candidatus Hydrogenedens sp.]|nr:sulfatase [Candidatus Hydrogenedens sp.]
MSFRQIFLIIFIIAIGSVIILFGYYFQKNYVSKPNIVFILIDTLRADCINPDVEPNPITPFLSKLAQKSIYFSCAVTPCSWTKPTMATLLTGLPTEKHGVRYSVRNEDPNAPVSDVLNDTFTTLPEYLSQQGYETYAVQSNANLAPLLGFAQGFREDHFIFQNDAPASFVTEKSIQFVNKTKRPFFLYSHFMDPHLPYNPPSQYLNLLKNSDGAVVDKTYIAPNVIINYLMELVYYNLGKRSEPPSHDFTEQEKKELRRRYHAEIRFTDAEVEKLVTIIKKKYPNTIFFILADHGEEFWEHKGAGHGTSLYEEQIRVPVIIHGRGIKPKKIDTPISIAGFAKTVVSLVDLPPPSQFEGYNLLEEKDKSTRIEMVTWGPWKDMGLNLKGIMKYPWKLILDRNTNKIELYNLTEDPKELTNVYERHPEIVSELMEPIESTSHKKEIPTSENTMTLPAELKEQLEKQGYL